MNAVMDIAFKANILSLRKHWGAFTVGYIPDQGVACMIVKGTIFPMISQDFLLIGQHFIDRVEIVVDSPG